MSALVCPECGERAERREPILWLVPAPRPAYRHEWDASPLCPVVGEQGYRPAEPDEVAP